MLRLVAKVNRPLAGCRLTPPIDIPCLSQPTAFLTHCFCPYASLVLKDKQGLTTLPTARKSPSLNLTFQLTPL